MIYITGDTHGINDFEKLIHHEFKKEDYLIICGDCGIVWNQDKLPIYIKFYEELNCTVLFVDGNHENFSLLNKFPIKNYLGGKVHVISDNIYHLMRGEVFTIEGFTFLAFGGADSIDKHLRKENISWWEEERPTLNDIDNALKNLEKHKNNVDYIITHTCDEKTLYNKCFRSINAKIYPSNTYLNFLEQINYKKWFFGHYHLDQEIDEKKRCLYHDIIYI